MSSFWSQYLSLVRMTLFVLIGCCVCVGVGVLIARLVVSGHLAWAAASLMALVLGYLAVGAWRMSRASP